MQRSGTRNLEDVATSALCLHLKSQVNWGAEHFQCSLLPRKSNEGHLQLCFLGFKGSRQEFRIASLLFQTGVNVLHQ